MRATLETVSISAHWQHECHCSQSQSPFFRAVWPLPLNLQSIGAEFGICMPDISPESRGPICTLPFPRQGIPKTPFQFKWKLANVSNKRRVSIDDVAKYVFPETGRGIISAALRPMAVPSRRTVDLRSRSMFQNGTVNSHTKTQFWMTVDLSSICMCVSREL
jgi:hypothetical protein